MPSTRNLKVALMSFARPSILLRNALLFDDPQYGRLAHGKLVKIAHSRRSQRALTLSLESGMEQT